MQLNHTHKRIIIGDPHTIFRLGLSSLLSRNEFVHIVGDTDTASGLIDLATKSDADTIIVDYDLPDMDGIEAIRHIKQRKPGTRTILLSSQDSPAIREAVSSHSIEGFILKFHNPDQIIKGINLVLEGHTFLSEIMDEGQRGTISSKTGSNSEQSHPLQKLTRKEKEIMKCLAQGLTYRETGEKLGITVKTVEFHRGNLTRKLGKKSIADITRMSLAWGLIEQDMDYTKSSTTQIASGN